jgi:hypothetical protein
VKKDIWLIQMSLFVASWLRRMVPKTVNPLQCKGFTSTGHKPTRYGVPTRRDKKPPPLAERRPPSPCWAWG